MRPRHGGATTGQTSIVDAGRSVVASRFRAYTKSAKQCANASGGALNKTSNMWKVCVTLHRDACQERANGPPARMSGRYPFETTTHSLLCMRHPPDARNNTQVVWRTVDIPKPSRACLVLNLCRNLARSIAEGTHVPSDDGTNDATSFPWLFGCGLDCGMRIPSRI
jgi:hypothetical protein